MNTLAALAAMASGEPASAELVDRYYTLCIPFYREFLGDHWHTGFYPEQGPIGPADQLRMELLVARSAGIAPGSRVLDVGCGVGGTACHLARAFGAYVSGLTPNATQRELAQARAGELGLRERTRFDTGWAHALPYESGSFDAVLFFESACHFPDRAAFFAEALRVLRPGGCLAGEDWLAGEGGEPVLRWTWCARVEQAWAIPALGTVGQYAALMRAAGFEVELACDMREEMPLLRGFLADRPARAAVAQEARETADPVRRQIMEALVVLGKAAQLGAFTVGRFVARKPG